jgi:site-specific DNA recombinase
MIAAIYARKSTDQSGVSDDQKSVARQVEHARSYAQRKGWTVDEACVYVDDGISGAEFANRPGFLRLMNALRPRPPFQVLLVSELSRIGREQLETGYAVKQLSQAGVTIVSYIEDRELLLDTPTDKFLMSAVSFAAEIERDKARQRTYDAMVRKARAGHVTGGRLFGYDNVDVAGADGDRSHVERRINRGEAIVVQKIFQLCARGEGLKGIAKTLNAGGALAPRNQQGRSRTWAPSSVREVLHRSTYRGLITWNKTKKRDAWGQRNCTDRSEADWLIIPAEQLRIVSDAQWEAAHARLTQRRASYARWKQGQGGEPDGRGVRRQYFLAGFGRCSCCGGSMQVVSRSSTTGRLFRYICSSYWNRGRSVCANGLTSEMPLADGAIRQLLRKEILGRTAVVERALERAVEILRVDHTNQPRQALERQLAGVETELANLAETAARGGAVPIILEKLTDRDSARRRLTSELAALQRVDRPLGSVTALRRQLRARLGQWDELLGGNIAAARPLLSDVLADRIAFHPKPKTRQYELVVRVAFDRILTAVVPELRDLQDRVASPTGFEPVFWP